jgi:hypothetical protein
MFQFIEDVDELAAGETTQQQATIVTVCNRQRGRSVAAALAVVRAGTANQPSVAVAATLKGNANLIGAHRDTEKARLAMV